MRLDTAGLRAKFLGSGKASDAALRVATSCKTEGTVAKQGAAARQEIDALSIVEEILERIAIVMEDAHCNEGDAQRIAAEQIGSRYVFYMRGKGE